MDPKGYPFGELATDYDGVFTHSTIGHLMRLAVWKRFEARFLPGQYVLELNCGTGEDAIYLAKQGVRVLATDRSARMVHLAQLKVRNANLTSWVQVRKLAMEQLDRLEVAPFDGAFSNFGGFNCVSDWATISRLLACRLRPQAAALICVMGPMAPWEWFGNLLRGRPKTAFRRLWPGGVNWRGITIRYPSIGKLRRAFSPDFRLLRVSGIGALLPPPAFEEWANRHLRLVGTLSRWERRLESMPPIPWFADHYLMELERV